MYKKRKKADSTKLSYVNTIELDTLFSPHNKHIAIIIGTIPEATVVSVTKIGSLAITKQAVKDRRIIPTCPSNG